MCVSLKAKQPICHRSSSPDRLSPPLFFHFCQLSPHDQAVLLRNQGQLAPGQSHQSPGTARLPLLSWEAGTLVSLKGGATQSCRELNETHILASRACLSVRRPSTGFLKSYQRLLWEVWGRGGEGVRSLGGGVGGKGSDPAPPFLKV